jgi:hypothetical protein
MSRKNAFVFIPQAPFRKITGSKKAASRISTASKELPKRFAGSADCPKPASAKQRERGCNSMSAWAAQ